MDPKFYSIIIFSSIHAFALITTIIPAIFAQNNTGISSEGGDMTGMTQS